MKKLTTLLLLILFASCATNTAPPTEEVIAPVQESKTSISEAVKDRANSDPMNMLSGAYSSVILAEAIYEKCGYQDENNVKVLAEAKRGLNIRIMAFLRPDLSKEQIEEINFDSNDAESVRLSLESVSDKLACGPKSLEIINKITKTSELLLKEWSSSPDE